MNDDEVTKLTKDEITKLLNLRPNFQMLFILGVVSNFLSRLKKLENLPVNATKEINWVLQAIENVVYLDKPIPPMDEKE